MSPSQNFQFAYNAYCALEDATYEHSVTRIFHAMMLSGNGIADLTLLPLRVLEVNFGHPLDLRPVFSAMMHCPLVYGVVFHGVARPDILRSISPLVRANQHLSLVDLHGCRAELGVDDLAEAIRTNTKSRVRYWDLSDNNFPDLTAFCAILAATRAAVFYLNLSRAGLTAEATLILFRALQSNKHLWGITHLLFAGAKMTDEAADVFVEHLENLASRQRLALKTIDISCTGCYDKVVGALNQFQPPLVSLHIGRAVFKSGKIDDLLTIVSRSEHLRELDLRGAQLRLEQLDQLIWAISKNSRITDFALDLSQMALNGKKLAGLLAALKEHNSAKFTRLTLDGNDMGTADLNASVDLFLALLNLRALSIGENFDRKDKRLPAALARLVEIPKLERLSIAGNQKQFLGEALIPLLHAVKASQTLLALDVSSNRIGNAGIDAICNILRENRIITEVRFDGSKCTNVEAFRRVWEIIGSDQNERVHVCPFAFTDCYELVQAAGSSKRSLMFDMFSDIQKKAQDSMQERQAALGIHSELSDRKIPELDQLLDDVTVSIHELLEGVKVTEHAAISAAFGLPLPHRDQAEDAAGADDPDSPYGTPSGTVVEESVIAAEGMATLMFNSLMIRRPEARGQIAAPASFISLDEGEGAATEEPAEEAAHNPNDLAATNFDALSD